MSKEKKNNKQELNLEDLGGVNGGVAVYGMDQSNLFGMDQQNVKGQSVFAQLPGNQADVKNQVTDQNNVKVIVQNPAGIGIPTGGGKGTGTTGLVTDMFNVKD